MDLSREQQIAFDKYAEGANVFVTGPGGTGKSVLIREIFKDALSKKKKIAVCAMTGCAAVLLKCNARTIHSWGGLGRCVGEPSDIIQRIYDNKYKRRNWECVHILVIDEVSMMSKKLFGILNDLGKKIRKSNQPFGGIQLIFSGDFFQLPPVGEKNEVETSQFCFENDQWSDVFPRNTHVLLHKIFRQEDETYAKVLNQLREGRLKRSSYDILVKQVGKPPLDETDVTPTKLFPRRSSVDKVNNEEMSKIPGDARSYIIQRVSDLCPVGKGKKYSTQELDYEYDYLQGSIPGENEIMLKVGAQVMCVVNIEDAGMGHSLCNGSQGKVVGFSEKNMPIVKFRGIAFPITMAYHTWASESIPHIGLRHIPLALAWAMTIHKSQGTTLDLAEIDVGDGVFECGQTYVALSRVKSLEGLYLTKFNYQRVFTNKKVKEFYKSLDTEDDAVKVSATEEECSDG